MAILSHDTMDCDEDKWSRLHDQVRQLEDMRVIEYVFRIDRAVERRGSRSSNLMVNAVLGDGVLTLPKDISVGI